MNNQLLFRVTNRHGEASGVPPHIDEQTFSGVYRGYFENQNGEQAISCTTMSKNVAHSF